MKNISIEEDVLPRLLYRLGAILYDSKSTTNEVLRAGRIIADIHCNHPRREPDEESPPVASAPLNQSRSMH